MCVQKKGFVELQHATMQEFKLFLRLLSCVRGSACLVYLVAHVKMAQQRVEINDDDYLGLEAQFYMQYLCIAIKLIVLLCFCCKNMFNALTAKKQTAEQGCDQPVLCRRVVGNVCLCD